ncbi:peptide-methionine (R)-S-oxide reductase MsrB [Neomegalonema sp.]|uniref:peptide-methionine (R)-S-oxide reductase MsrB n=1 Tax=Neomegalonema sp. TaxID=2039713 RepID=UPI0026299F40|nr:peptide-methionine (R)-S-oxide reductase MsrB [Neomegalonema sp.]MDD2868503.1 peptide-methionine (R)-S-oxide reductase MsrB [Neomegalonema sp.]
MVKIKKTDEEWRAQLTPEAYRVTRRAGTERPFSQAPFPKGEAVFQCVCCGAELFESEAKYESGCGWPSFTAPAGEAAVEERVDHSHGMTRVEVLCSQCDAHLGHVFPDGPGPEGLRYCINAAALKHEPKALSSETDEVSSRESAKK